MPIQVIELDFEIYYIFLGPGDPYLAPDPSVISEALIASIRFLHSTYPKWTSCFNRLLQIRLESAKSCKRAGDEISLTQVIIQSSYRVIYC